MRCGWHRAGPAAGPRTRPAAGSATARALARTGPRPDATAAAAGRRSRRRCLRRGRRAAAFGCRCVGGVRGRRWRRGRFGRSAGSESPAGSERRRVRRSRSLGRSVRRVGVAAGRSAACGWFGVAGGAAAVGSGRPVGCRCGRVGMPASSGSTAARSRRRPAMPDRSGAGPGSPSASAPAAMGGRDRAASGSPGAPGRCRHRAGVAGAASLVRAAVRRPAVGSPATCRRLGRTSRHLGDLREVGDLRRRRWTVRGRDGDVGAGRGLRNRQRSASGDRLRRERAAVGRRAVRARQPIGDGGTTADPHRAHRTMLGGVVLGHWRGPSYCSREPWDSRAPCGAPLLPRPAWPTSRPVCPPGSSRRRGRVGAPRAKPVSPPCSRQCAGPR